MENKIYIHKKYTNQEETQHYHEEPVLVESKRRSLLKYVFFGGGFFMLGKIFGPSISLFSSDGDFSKITDFQNFRIIESGKELQFFDKMGNEILTLDKEA